MRMLSFDSFLSQGESVRALLRQLHEGRMTHALLISGESGMGKWSLAVLIAAALLCENPGPDGEPCFKCRSCLQMADLAHPDLIILQKGKPISSSEAKSVIPVDDIREMISRISLRGFQSSRRVVMIRHAEDMNEAAQNKLLKTLEEPPENTYFLLTSVKNLLLPTIISRCRPFLIHPWPEATIRKVLADNGLTGLKADLIAAEAGGSIGKALKNAGDESYWEFREKVIHDFLACTRRSDLLQISSRWKDSREKAEEIFSVLDTFVNHLMHQALMHSSDLSQLDGCPEKWREFARKADPEGFIRIIEALSLARKQVQFSVSFQVVVEQLILMLMEAVGG